jgi:hypothetical protein
VSFVALQYYHLRDASLRAQNESEFIPLIFVQECLPGVSISHGSLLITQIFVIILKMSRQGYVRPELRD